jgi:hypothetical protein
MDGFSVSETMGLNATNHEGDVSDHHFDIHQEAS